MKRNWLISLKLTLVLIVLCGGLFPLLISLIGKTSTGGGKGRRLFLNGRVVGYEIIGQNFTSDKYFRGRPSAVSYNAAGSGGSNKGPSNTDYLLEVRGRIDSFLAHNPGVRRSEIPAELVTASGSGLDPHISPASAFVQIKRVAGARKIPEIEIRILVEKNIQKFIFGPPVVNVLELNMDLDRYGKQE